MPCAPTATAFAASCARWESRRKDGKSPDGRLARLAEAVRRSVALREARRRGVPPIRYDDDLPVSAKRDEIGRAIRDHQVVIVCGETGSGKSTQLPKICLELGRGIDGLIGHTQPRRIAARSVAARIAEELASPLGPRRGLQGPLRRGPLSRRPTSS